MGAAEAVADELRDAQFVVLALEVGFQCLGLFVAGGIDDGHGAGHNLLGAYAGEDGNTLAPVEAAGAHGGLDGLADAGHVGVLGLATGVGIGGEIAEGPDNDGGAEDDGTHLLEVLLAFLPGVAQDGLGGGHTVGRQLHDERQALALDDEAAEELGQEDGHDEAEEVEAHEDIGGIVAEEGGDQDDIDRDARGARHHGDDEHGEQAAAAVLDGAGGHDGGNVASEAHDHGYEALAVEAHAVHELVHDEGRSGHVA